MITLISHRYVIETPQKNNVVAWKAFCVLQLKKHRGYSIAKELALMNSIRQSRNKKLIFIRVIIALLFISKSKHSLDIKNMIDHTGKSVYISNGLHFDFF